MILEKNLVLIDFNNTLIRALAVNKELSWRGNITGGFFGFTRMLSAVINFTAPTNIIVCSDKKPYFREDIYSKFKKNRVITDDDGGFFEALKFNKGKTLELLEMMNIPVILERGYEADDWIAYFAKELHTQFDKVIIVSNDTDLLSLLHYNGVCIYKTGAKTAKPYLYDVQSFQDDYYPVTPKTFDLYTAMVGSHNNFPGIKGIGPVTAKKILSDVVKLNNLKLKYKDHFEQAEKVLTIPYPGIECKVPYSEVLPKHKSIQTKIDRLLASQGINMSSTMNHAFNFYR